MFAKDIVAHGALRNRWAYNISFVIDGPLKGLCVTGFRDMYVSKV